MTQLHLGIDCYNLHCIWLSLVLCSFKNVILYISICIFTDCKGGGCGYDFQSLNGLFYLCFLIRRTPLNTHYRCPYRIVKAEKKIHIWGRRDAETRANDVSVWETEFYKLLSQVPSAYSAICRIQREEKKGYFVHFL